MGTTTQLDVARVATLIARLDPRTDQPCDVAGCVHEPAAAHAPLAA